MERDDFQHAVIQMLQHYWAGKEPKETTRVSPDMKYKKSYFDKMDPDAASETKEKRNGRKEELQESNVKFKF